MNHPQRRQANDQLQIRDFVQHLRANPKKWFVPTAICVLLAMGYALLRSPSYEATQSVSIRNEATAASEAGLGRFRDLDDMKVSQETILEVIQSPDVIRRALATVDSVDASSINEMDVNDLRDVVKVTPPDGAELGKTEIIYIKLKAKDQARAKELTVAIAKQAQIGLRKLREAKLQGMFAELTHSAEVSEADLHVSREKLSALEVSLGGDLAELRMLDGSGTVDSDLHRRLNSIEDELRQTRETQRTNKGLLALLRAAQSDPESILATPNRLLESQPALRRLKDGLVDAQLRQSKILGSMTANHPLAAAANTEAEEVKRSLHNELVTAISGLNVELNLTDQRMKALQLERDALNARLSKLAGIRAEYSALASDVKHRTTLLEDARRQQAAARASLAGVDAANLLTMVDEARVSPRPVGPSRTMITLLGLVGGLAIGVGYTFFTTPATPAPATGNSNSIDQGAAQVVATTQPRTNGHSAASGFAPRT
ncbi:MAG: Wzz/FepE/Etk N-terminal domain-containing protein [Pirellulales bacterium]|nr:Wzz/FepE/Etk N-terminal domain-containing protein [Pirellulales bacterium]